MDPGKRIGRQRETPSGKGRKSWMANDRVTWKGDIFKDGKHGEATGQGGRGKKGCKRSGATEDRLIGDLIGKNGGDTRDRQGTKKQGLASRAKKRKGKRKKKLE